MTAHVSASPNKFTKRAFATENRFAVACLFNFGYELDCSDFSAEKLNKTAKLSSFYKKRRKLIQYGDFYRLGELSCVCGYEVISLRKDEALACVIMRSRENGVSNRRIAFKGFIPSEKYKVTVYNKNLNPFDEFTASGETMNAGVPYEKYRLSEEVCSDADFRSFLIGFSLIK